MQKMIEKELQLTEALQLEQKARQLEYSCWHRSRMLREIQAGIPHGCTSAYFLQQAQTSADELRALASTNASPLFARLSACADASVDVCRAIVEQA